MTKVKQQYKNYEKLKEQTHPLGKSTLNPTLKSGRNVMQKQPFVCVLHNWFSLKFSEIHVTIDQFFSNTSAEQ